MEKTKQWQLLYLLLFAFLIWQIKAKASAKLHHANGSASLCVYVYVCERRADMLCKQIQYENTHLHKISAIKIENFTPKTFGVLLILLACLYVASAIPNISVNMSFVCACAFTWARDKELSSHFVERFARSFARWKTTSFLTGFCCKTFIVIFNYWYYSVHR